MSFDLPEDVPVLVGRNRISLREDNLDIAASRPCIPNEYNVEEWTGLTWHNGNPSVVTSGNRISADVPRWAGTINSYPFSMYSMTNNYEVSFTVDYEPNEVSVIGLGIQEWTRNWRDIDYAFRVGTSLDIYEKGEWRAGSFSVKRGDVLSLYVNDGRMSYRLNGVEIASGTYGGSPDFYVDTAFGTGAYIVSASNGLEDL